ncbi:EPAB2 protein, partial [Probosciger aterrimus]|nr:EPAB2 protein [Probosciger aterrimus]
LAAMEASLDVAEMAALQKATDDSSDSSHLEGDSERERAAQSQKLQAIKARVQDMKKEAEWIRELQVEDECSLAGNLEAATLYSAGLFSENIYGKTEVDQRSIYVGNVDYGAAAEELESFFRSCGEINRVTILCNRFSGRPKGYAYIEFKNKSSVRAAMELNKSLFRDRVIKVLPKRTKVPGISNTDRGGYQGHFHASRGLSQWGFCYEEQYRSLRGRAYRGRAKMLPCYI